MISHYRTTKIRMITLIKMPKKWEDFVFLELDDEHNLVMDDEERTINDYRKDDQYNVYKLERKI